MGLFRPKTRLDRVFAVSIVLKGLDGLGEVAAGLFLLLVTPDQINRTVRILTRGELAEDPRDFVSTHLVAAAHRLSSHGLIFVALYLLAHGLIKVVLVIALLRDQLWAYPWMMAALTAFITYQTYQIALRPSAGLIGLTIFDAFVLLLTWREYRVRRQPRAAGP